MVRAATKEPIDRCAQAQIPIHTSVQHFSECPSWFVFPGRTAIPNLVSLRVVARKRLGYPGWEGKCHPTQPPPAESADRAGTHLRHSTHRLRQTWWLKWDERNRVQSTFKNPCTTILKKGEYLIGVALVQQNNSEWSTASRRTARAAPDLQNRIPNPQDLTPTGSQV